MHFGSNNFANRFWAHNHFGRALDPAYEWASHFGSNHFASNHHLSFHWERESESPLGFVSVLHLTGILGAGGDPTPLFGYRTAMDLCGVMVTGGLPAAGIDTGSIPVRMPVQAFVTDSDEDEWMLIAAVLGGV